MFKSITKEEAEKLLAEKTQDKNFAIIDVRTPQEFAMGYIGEAMNIDLYDSDFVEKIKKLDRNKVYFIYCRSGSRSKAALEVMEQVGFEEVYELMNGILDWNFS